MQNPYEENPDSDQMSGSEYQELLNSRIPPVPGKRRMKKKKRGSFLGGLFTGLICGMLVMALGLGLLVNAYIKYTGNSITIHSNTSSQPQAKKDSEYSDTELLDEATISKINTLLLYENLYYKDEVNLDDIRNELFHGVLDGLGDQYSVYYTAEEYAELQIDTSGVYYGIGAGLTQDKTTMRVTVSKVYRGTPSEEAGMMKGDEILYVDDIDATSMELSDLVKQIRGEEGTTVHLVLYREGETLELDVERRHITLPSVEGQMLDNGMGYIIISDFQSTTAEQFKTIYEDLKAQGMKGVILDLRANPGGLLSTVVDMLDYLLPEGTVVYTEDKNGEQVIYSSNEKCVEKIPTVVLVDGGSASASEIFAGAMKDYEYATLVGVTTFGKGIVQSIIPLQDGDAIKLTTAKYYTPKGNYIHGVGIEPDIVLEYEFTGPEDATVYEMQYDNQLQKAIEVLGDLMNQ